MIFSYYVKYMMRKEDFFLLVGSFEVSVEDKVVFSKIATYGFPYEKDVSLSVFQ